MNRVPSIFLKTALLLIALFAFYLLIIFIPGKLRLTQKNNLTKAYLNLVQNRIALVNLIKLNPDSPTLSEDKSLNIKTLDETIKEGLEKPLKIKSRLQKEYQRILSEEKSIISELKQKTSFEEGIAYLKSDKVVLLLTDEANLILKLQSEIKKLE